MIGNPGEWPDRTHPFAAAVDVQGFGACLLLVTVYLTQYRGHQRYCRVVVNLSGAHATGTPIGVIALRGHAHVAPVTT